MNIEALVAYVTRQVLKQIQDIDTIQIDDKPRILIVDNGQQTYGDLVTLLREHGLHVDYMKEGQELTQVEHIILPGLNHDQLIHATLGQVNDQITHVLREAYLHNIHVIILSEGIQYRKYKGMANEVYYGMFLDYEKRLISYGTSIVKGEDLLDTIEGNIKSVELLDKKVITQADLKKLYEAGLRDIRISKASILSPLASDYIRSSNIRIRRI